jgi:FAD:protein FMN transferase
VASDRRLGARAYYFLFFLAACAVVFADEPLKRFEFREMHMGTLFRIVLYAPDVSVANHAAEAAFRRVAALDRVMTDYNPDSELMRLSRQPVGVATPVSNDLFDAIQHAQYFAEKTDGACDMTVGPIVQLWRAARKTRKLPDPAAIAEALKSVGYKKLKLDASARTITLLSPKMQLDLGGFGKGYAADQALAVMRKDGIRSAMVIASGDIAIGDAPPGMQGWKVGIGIPDAESSDLAAKVLLHNAGVSTSGDTEQYVEINGVRYSHIVDPKTGFGLTHRTQTTIIAKDATTSDGFDTALCVMGEKRAIEFVDAMPETAAFIIVVGEKGNKVLTSRRFEKLKVP